MKKITFIFALLCASVMGWATQYCGVTSSNANFTFSIMNVSGNTYRIQFDAVGADKFGSTPYNVNCGVNQSAGAGIFFGGDNAANWVMTDERAYLDFSTASTTSVPTGFYGNYFCFNKKGGGLIEITGFNPSDVDWTATCGSSCSDTQAPTVSAVSVMDVTYKSAVLTITASDNTAVTRYVVKNGELQIAQGTTNVITLSNLASGTTYSNIKVYAYDACNNESDAFSVAEFTTETITYCRYATGHLGQAEFGDIYGRILVTIKKVDNSTIGVKVEPNNNGTRGIKYLNIIVNGVGHEYGNNDGSGDDLTGYFNISGLASLNFNININFYCNTPNWTTQQFSVTEDQLCDESPVVLSEGSEYCGDYGVECDRHNGAYAYLKWETTEDGDVVITMVDGNGSTNARFRGNNGMGENLNGFTVLSGTGFATSEPASNYFTRVYVANGNTFKLQRKGGALLPSPAKIRFASPALEWYCTQDGDSYAWPTYEYTYGKTCAVVSGYSVSASANDVAMGTVTAKVGDEDITHVDAGTTVRFTATANDTYVFVNWTKSDAVVSTNPVYDLEINENTYLTANFDYIRDTYCHTAVMSNEGKKFYLTLGSIGGGQYQIKFEGSSEAKITGINDANFQINGVSTSWDGDGLDVPFSKANGAWTFDDSGYGSVYTTFELAAGKTWKDIYAWTHYMYFACEGMGQQTLTDAFPNRYRIAWDETCADEEAPVFAKAEAEVLNESSVRLKIQASDNWEGLLAYTIARAGADPIISNHASGEEFEQEVTGLTAGTEYDFTVTVSDGVNNANTHIVVTPVGDTEKPVMGEASLDSKTWHSAIINVAATDNKGVTAYYVVEKDADYVAAEGKITVEGLAASTEYTLHIKAKDAAGNISDNQAEVSFKTDAHSLVPTTAAPVPTWPAAQVKSIYSDTYELAPAHTPNYNAPWWGAPAITLGEIDGNHFMDYDLANDGMIGWQYDEISVASMEKVHIDIYASAAGTVTIRPITNGDPDEVNNVRKTLNLAANQWNSFDIALTEFPGHDWTKLFQFSIEYWNAGGLTGEHISVDNVYFYRTSAYVDTEDPTAFTASLASESYFSVKINAQASDNSGAVIFTVKNGDDIVATQNAASAAATVINVTNLNAGTAYNLNVYVADETGNTLDPIAIAATTMALPDAAPTPTHEAKAVKSIYSEAYESAIPVGINFNEWWWQSPTVAQEVSLGGNNARYYSGLNTNGSFGITWSVDHKLDAAGYQKVHFHIYPTNSATIEIYLVIQPEGEFHRTSETLEGGKWNEVVIDYSDKTFAPFNQFGIVYTEALGDFFIDNLYFYSDPDYTRNVTDGNYGTICLPQAGDIVGATLYEIADYANNMIYVDEVEGGVMEAGKPYIFQATSDKLNVYYTSATVEETAGSANGLHGFYNLENENAQFDIPEDAGNYILYQNQYWLVSGRAAYINNFRAYIKIGEINYTAPSPSRRRVAMTVNGEQTATGMDAINATDAPVKMVINGQLFILRGEKMYDTTGRLVK